MYYEDRWIVAVQTKSVCNWRKISWQENSELLAVDRKRNVMNGRTFFVLWWAMMRGREEVTVVAMLWDLSTI